MDATDAPMIGHNNPPPERPLTIEEKLRRDHAGLLDKVQELADRANAEKARIDAQGGIKSDEDLPEMIEIGKLAQKMAKRLDDTRLVATEDLRETVDKINKFFNLVKERCDRIKKGFAAKVGEYDQEKRAREARETAERARIAKEEAERKAAEAEAASNTVMGDVLMHEAALAEKEASMAAHHAVKTASSPTRTDAGTVSTTTVWTYEIIDSSKIPIDQLRDFILQDREVLDRLLAAYVRTFKGTKQLPGVTIYPDTRTTFR